MVEDMCGSVSSFAFNGVHPRGGRTGPGRTDVSQRREGCSGALMDPRPHLGPPSRAALPAAPLARVIVQGGSAGHLSLLFLLAVPA